MKSMKFFFLSVSVTSLCASPIAFGSLILSSFTVFVNARRSLSCFNSIQFKVFMAKVQASRNIHFHIES